MHHRPLPPTTVSDLLKKIDVDIVKPDFYDLKKPSPEEQWLEEPLLMVECKRILQTPNASPCLKMYAYHIAGNFPVVIAKAKANEIKKALETTDLNYLFTSVTPTIAGIPIPLPSTDFLYSMGINELGLSKNEYVEEFKTKSAYTVNNPPADSGLDQLLKDTQRDIKIQGISFSKELESQKTDADKEAYLKKILTDTKFTALEADNTIHHYSQLLNYLSYSPILQSSLPGPPYLNQPEEADREYSPYKDDKGDVYYKASVKKYPLGDMYKQPPIEYLDEPLEVLYKLENTGFKFLSLKTNSLLLQEIYLKKEIPPLRFQLSAGLPLDLRELKNAELAIKNGQAPTHQAVSAALKNNTSDETLKKLKELSIGNPHVESVVKLLEREQLLYWLTVNDPQKFIALLENNLDSGITTAKLARLLLAASRENIINCNSQKIANFDFAPNISLGTNDHQRTMQAAKLITWILEHKKILHYTPEQRFLEQIERIPENFPPSVIAEFLALKKDPSNFKEKFLKFYMSVYTQEKRIKVEGNAIKTSRTPFLQALQRIINAPENIALLPDVVRTDAKSLKPLHISLIRNAGALPALRTHAEQIANKAIQNRDKSSATNALTLIRDMNDVPGLNTIQARNDKLPVIAGVPLLYTGKTTTQLRDDYEHYRKLPLYEKQTSPDEKNLFVEMKRDKKDDKANTAVLESIVTDRDRDTGFSSIRRLEKMSVIALQKAIKKADPTKLIAVANKEASDFFIAAQTERFLDENLSAAEKKVKLTVDGQKAKILPYLNTEVQNQLNGHLAKKIPELFKDIKKQESKAANPIFDPSTVPLPAANTLGDTLLTQLTAPGNKGLDSVISIASLLPFEKQIAFLHHFNLPVKTLMDIYALYQQYRPDQKKINDLTKEFEEKRSEIHRDIKDLNTQLKNASSEHMKIQIEASLTLLADELEELNDHLKENILAAQKSLKKGALRAGLNAVYKDLINAMPRHASKKDWHIWLQELFQSPEGYPSNFLNSKIINVGRKHPSKLELRKKFEDEKVGNIKNLLYMAPKEGGANDPGTFGARYIGCYLDNDGKIRPQIIFNKQATDNAQANHRENIAEVITSHIMSDIIGDHAGSAYFALKPDGKLENPDDVYVASIFFDKFKDAHLLAHEKQGFHDPFDNKDEDPDPEHGTPPRGKGQYGGQKIDAGRSARPSFMRGNPAFRDGLEKLAKEGRTAGKKDPISPKGLAKSLFASMLMGNYQNHTENVGVGTIAGKDQFVIFDFGGAFRRPFAHSERYKGYENNELTQSRFGKNVNPENHEGEGLKRHACYYLAYPESVRLSKEFIEGIEVAADHDRAKLVKSIDDSIALAIKFYGFDGFAKHFARELDTRDPILTQKTPIALADQPTYFAAVKEFLSDTLEARQLSIREFALESKLRNLLKYKDYRLEDLVKENPLYFARVRDGKGLESLNSDEKTALRKQLIKIPAPGLALSPEDQFVQRFLQLKDDRPQDILKQLSSYVEREPAKFTQKFKDYLKTAATKSYDDTDIGIVIQACDEAFNVVKKATAALKVAVGGAIVPDYKLDSLGDKLLKQINAGDTNAVDSIFELVSHLDSRKRASLQNKLRDVFKLKEDSDQMIEIYQSGDQDKINEEFKNLCKAQAIAGNVDKWLQILKSISFNKPEITASILDTTDEQRAKEDTVTRVDSIDIFSLDIGNHPTINKNANQITDDDLRDNLRHLNMNQWRYLAPKGEAGKQEAGPEGGWYTRPYTTQDGKIKFVKVLFKREEKQENIYVESLVGRIKRRLVGRFAAATFVTSSSDSAHTYAASIAFEKFEALHEKDRGLSRQKADNKVVQQITQDLRNKGYKGFEEALIACWWTADTDLHTGNVGTGKSINSPDDIFCFIDHGGSAPLGLDAVAHPNRTSTNIIAHSKRRAPNQSAAYYTEDQRINKKVSDAIDKHFENMSIVALKNDIDDELDKEAVLCKKHGELNAFINYRDLLKKLDRNDISTIASDDKKIESIRDELKDFLPKIMHARALSMLRFGMEIKTSLCFKYNKGRLTNREYVYDESQDKLDDLIKHSPNYYLGLRDNKSRYHFRGNRKSHLPPNPNGNSAFESIIESKLDAYLKAENTSGIQKLLLRDFNSDLKQRALCYIARVKLLKKYDNELNKPTTKYDELIKSLDEYTKDPFNNALFNNAEERDVCLTQLCDQAYDIIVKRFDNMPINDDKLKLYEVFHRAGALEGGSAIPVDITVLNDPDKTLAGFDIDKSAFTHELNTTLSHQLHFAETAQFNAAAWKDIGTVDSKIMSLEKTYDALKLLKLPADTPKLDAAKRNLDKVKERLEKAKDHRDHKSAPPNKQLYFYKHESKLKPIEIALNGNDTKTALEKDQRFSKILTASPEEQQVQLAGAKVENLPDEVHTLDDLTPDRAVFCPNPTDKFQNENNPSSGALITKKDYSMQIQELKEANNMTVAYIIAKTLANAPEFSLLPPNNTLTGSAKLLKIQEIVQQHYVNHIQSLSNAELVTKDNIEAFLDKIQDQGIAKITWGLRNTSGLAKKADKAYQEQTQINYKSNAKPKDVLLPAADYLAWAYFWISTLKSDPTSNLQNLRVTNVKGNPRFTEALLLIAAAEGVDPVNANRTKYDINIKPEQINAYREMINNPTHKLNKDIMGIVRTLENDTQAALRSANQLNALTK